MAEFCTSCGAALAPGDKFCTTCGAPAPEDLPVDATLVRAPMVREVHDGPGLIGSAGTSHVPTPTVVAVPSATGTTFGGAAFSTPPEAAPNSDHPSAHPAALALLVALPVAALLLGFVPSRWAGAWNDAPAAFLFPATAALAGGYAARIQPMGRWLLPLVVAASLIPAGMIISTAVDFHVVTTRYVAPLIGVPLLLGFGLSWVLRRVRDLGGILLAGLGLATGVVSDLFSEDSTIGAVLNGEFGFAALSAGVRAQETLSIVGLGGASIPGVVVPGILGAAGMTLLCVGLAMLLPRRGVVATLSPTPRATATHDPAGAPTLVALDQPLPEGTPGVVVGPDGRQYVMAAASPGTVATTERTNPLAGMALAFGILGGLVAIPLGHIALHQIKRTGERGRGMALTGLVFAYVWLAALVGFIVWLVSVANSTPSYY